MRIQLLITVGMLCLTAPATAQKWPEPYTQSGTVGKIFEDAFSAVVTDCGLPGVFHKKVKDSARRSAVPTEIRTNFRDTLAVSVIEQRQYGAAPLFAYVFPSEAAARTLQMVDLNRRMATPVDQDPVTMLVPGSSSLSHTESCNSIFTATLKAEAGIKVPAAHLSTAVDGNMSRTNRTLMTLTEGVYQSPLGYALGNAGATPSERLAAQLLTWRWYQDHQSVAGADNYYISGFRGGTVYRTTNASREGSGTADLRAGGSAPGIASIETALRAQYGLDAQTQIRAFGTFHYRDRQRGGPSLSVAVLPKPAEITRELVAVPRVVSDLQPPVTDLRPHYHIVELVGVPSTVCNATFWQIDRAPGGLGSLSLSKVDSLKTDAGPACRYTLELQLSGPPSQGSGQFALSYALVSRTKVLGEQIRIPVTVPLNTSAGPVLNLQVPNPDPALNNNVLTWTVDYQLLDPITQVNIGAGAQLQDGALTCASSVRQINISQPAWTGGQKLSITLTQPQADRFDTAARGQECSFTGTIVFNLIGSGTLKRTLAPAVIRHPIPVQAPPTPPSIP